MNFTMFLFYVCVYFAVKKLLELFVKEDKVATIDNDKVTYDVVKGVSLSERKVRLASGYYNKY
ncbi:MAG: hypothetical protein IKJ68_08435 [Clostridia bacterium]|nr:hypothetical protein [Clostridia bacterium]